MPERDQQDLANALLIKARGDEAGLRALADNSDVPDHVAGFLAQQAIEKSLKAVLTAREVEFERSHDIDYLFGLLEDAGLDLTPNLKAAVALTPWAVEFRYADPFAVASLDRSEALATVVVVREWAAQAIITEKAAERQPNSPSETETLGPAQT